MSMIPTPIEVFYSYADADEPLRNELEKHLSLLRHEGIITDWHKRQIIAGTDWAQALDRHLNTASVILLLISANFLASDYCYGREMQRAMQRYNEDDARVIPILLRPVDWQGAPFAKLKALPSNGIPITMWRNRDAALTDVAQGIRAAIEDAQGLPLRIPSIKPPGRKAVRVPFMAPDLPVTFVPRAHEFGQLLQRLLDPQCQNLIAITTALRGAGGFGKTTLAAALCHDESAQATFDDGILWVTLGERPDIAGALTKLYRALTNKHPDFVDVEEGARMLAEKLADRDCLLVIDDVWNLAHLRPFLQGGQRCARLITTRLLEIAVEAPTQITVDEMTSAESVQLLTARLPSASKNLKELKQLATRLGEWPLMLELANRALLTQMACDKTLEEALSWVNQTLDKRGVMGIARQDAEQRKASAAGTLAVSLDLLDRSQQERYIELAVFAEDVEVPLTALATLWSMDQFEVEELVQRLDDLSLLKFNGHNEMIHIHDVVRAYLTTQVQDMIALHAHLVDRWGDPYALPDSFAWRWYAYHLVGARRQGQLERLLLDIFWLEARLQHVEIWVLLRDYESTTGGEQGQTARDVGTSSQKMDKQKNQEPVVGTTFSEILPPIIHRSLLVTFMQALQREAHVLAKCSDLLFQQMYNRLQWERNIDILSLTTQSQRVAKLAAKPWLHLLTPRRESRALIRTFSGHRSGVVGCAFFPDGKSIISVSRDMTAKIWNAHTGQEIASFPELNGTNEELSSCAVSPDGSWVVTNLRFGHLSDEALRIWDANTYKLLFSIGANDEVTDCAVSPNGKLIASASVDGTVKLSDASSGKEILLLDGHEGLVWGCAFSPDGTSLVSASADKTLKIWDVATGKVRRTLHGHNDQVIDCEVNHNGKLVLSSSYDGTVRLWDLVTGNQEVQLNTQANNQVLCCAFGPDDSWAVTADSECSVEIWDLHTTQLRARLYGHTDTIVKCVLSPNGRQIVSASYDNTLKLWDVNAALSTGLDTETNLQFARSSLTTVVSPDGHWAISRTDNGDLKKWEIKTGKVMMVIPGHIAQATSCDLSPDGRLILAATSAGTLGLWDSASGSLIRTFRYSSLLSEKKQPMDSKEKLTFTLCRFSAKGKRVVAATSQGEMIVWNTLRGRKIVHAQIPPETTRDDDVWAIETCDISDASAWAVSPSEELLICAFCNRLLALPKIEILQMWRLKPGNCQLIKSIKVESFVNDIAISPIGDIFATATGMGSIVLWDLRDGSIIRELQGHESGSYEGLIMHLVGGVLKCAFSHDGKRLVSIANSREVKVWDIQDAKCLATMYLDEGLYNCTWHPDGKQIILGGLNGEHVVELLINQEIISESHNSQLVSE